MSRRGRDQYFQGENTRLNNKKKRRQEEGANMEDAFGTKLEVGDEVYYTYTWSGGRITLKRGIVTGFTDKSIQVRHETAANGRGGATKPDHVAKIFAAKGGKQDSSHCVNTDERLHVNKHCARRC